MAIDRHLIINDLGSNNWPLKRLVIESGGKLWTIYKDSGTAMRLSYSNDAGINWAEDVGNPFAAGLNNPSMDIDGNDDILASVTNSSSAQTPKYNKMVDGSWGSTENVSNVSNGSLSQVLATSGNVPYCVWRYAPSGTYTQIRAAKRTGGTWQSPVTLSLAAGWKTNSIAACMDDNDNIQVVWEAQSISVPTTYNIQTAYWNGTSWSSITAIETYSTSGTHRIPAIRFVQNKLFVCWARDGINPYNTKAQIMYSYSSDRGANWTVSDNVTEFDGHHYSYDITEGNGNNIYVIYDEIGADPNNSTILNLAYKQWDGLNWSSSKIVLTEESVNNGYLTAINNGSIIHVVWMELSTTSLYHGSFTSIALPTTKEIYDYVDILAADVGTTLELDPQVVLTEVGGKGDIIHLADDDSEERVGLSSNYIFYINIRYDLLDEADAGTLLDLWADTSKADGRKNSFYFSHPDGHTYVVRFDTDLNRLMSPTYYTIKNIRLRILGRIAD